MTKKMKKRERKLDRIRVLFAMALGLGMTSLFFSSDTTAATQQNLERTPVNIVVVAKN